MSKTVYMKFTLEDDPEFEIMALPEIATWFARTLGQGAIGTPEILLWDTLGGLISAEVDSCELMARAIVEHELQMMACMAGESDPEDTPTVADILIKLLHKER